MSALPNTHDAEMTNSEKELNRADSDSQLMHNGKLVGESDSESYIGRYKSGGSTSFVHDEPIIVTGEDVSNYAIDDRDDGDQSLTFRSLFIGTVVAGLGAALNEVWLFLYREDFCHPSIHCHRSTSLNQSPS